MDAQDVSAALDSRLHELQSLALLLGDEASAQRAARVRHLLAAIAELGGQSDVPEQRVPGRR